jgi:hypothetical protein
VCNECSASGSWVSDADTHKSTCNQAGSASATECLEKKNGLVLPSPIFVITDLL